MAESATIRQITSRPARPWWWRVGRLMLISNLVLTFTMAVAGVAAHKWATSSEERFERAIMSAVRYLLVFASLVEDQGYEPRHVEGALRLAEGFVIDGIGRAPRSDGHLYWQGRILMAMPAVYKRFGRNEERIERASRSAGIFADLVARNPGNIDYRRRLAVGANIQADDLAEMGRHAEAIARREVARAAAEDLLQRQPGFWRWRWYVQWAERGIAESLIATGRREEAAPHLETAGRLARELCGERPSDAHMCRLVERVGRLVAADRPMPSGG